LFSSLAVAGQVAENIAQAIVLRKATQEARYHSLTRDLSLLLLKVVASLIKKSGRWLGIALFTVNFLTGHCRKGDHRFVKWTRFFSWSVGLTYERAVKLVVGVLKSGTVLCNTHAHIGLLNVTYVCLSFNLQYLRYERQRVVKFGVSVFVSYDTCATE